EAVALEPAQREGKHSLRDAAECAAQLAEPLRALAEHAHHEHRPFVADPCQDLADRAAILGHREGTRYQRCAFLLSRLGHLSSLGIKGEPRLAVAILICKSGVPEAAGRHAAADPV